MFWNSPSTSNDLLGALGLLEDTDRCCWLSVDSVDHRLLALTAARTGSGFTWLGLTSGIFFITPAGDILPTTKSERKLKGYSIKKVGRGGQEKFSFHVRGPPLPSPPYFRIADPPSP